MNPITAIFTSLRKSFTFAGRAGRAEFWWFQALRIVVAFAFLISLTLMFAQFGAVAADDQSFANLINTVVSHSTAILLTSFLVLVLLPASYASSVRRLHDRGHPGWPLWLVFIAAFFQFYIFLIALILMIYNPQGTLAWFETTTQSFVNFAEGGGDVEGYINSGFSYFLITIASIGIIFGPLYFIFFSIQACLPSVAVENRHGLIPNTPSQNEVFQ